MTAPELLDRFADYYEANPTWGVLHVVLDDGNLSDTCVMHAIAFAEREGDHEGRQLAWIVLAMSQHQRAGFPDKVDAYLRAGRNPRPAVLDTERTEIEAWHQRLAITTTRRTR